MKGRIKKFLDDKGYGFIIGEDGVDYFFHILQVKDMVELRNWMVVEFDIENGKKGKTAVNIRVPEPNNTSKFITCGNKNIRLNNIKEYGIDVYMGLYQKTRDHDYAYIRDIDEVAYSYYKDGKYGSEYIAKKCNCLYITTYQDDYIRFIEDEVNFNIYNKCQEIADALK